jgi:hypothetical protein
MLGFRAWIAAAVLAVGTGLVSGPATADENAKPPEDPGLKTAAYDVIIVPRQGGGAPRVMTERGWRSLSPQSSRVRTWSRRQTFVPRGMPRWNDRYADRYVRPVAPYPRWTSDDGYRNYRPRQRPYTPF